MLGDETYFFANKIPILQIVRLHYELIKRSFIKIDANQEEISTFFKIKIKHWEIDVNINNFVNNIGNFKSLHTFLFQILHCLMLLAYLGNDHIYHAEFAVMLIRLPYYTWM